MSLGIPSLPEDVRIRCNTHRDMPLVQLTRLIAEEGDKGALHELHACRPVFRDRSGGRVLLTDFLLHLKHRDLTFQWCGRDSVVVDHAYDLTLAKFHQLPSDSLNRGPADSCSGPDCRYYFRAFHKHVTKEFCQHPPENAIDAEIRVANVLQRLVTRHFYFSCLECWRRAAKLVRRYTWKIDGQPLILWMPIELGGRRCHQWLQENIPDVDPARPGERDRVQDMVDRLLTHRRVLSLDQLRETGASIGIEDIEEPITWASEVSVAGLADAVAQEKAETIDDQRPSIRGLGEGRLKDLIRTIFESLAQDGYHADRIASKFGLSKATFSRFAGCRWHCDGNEAMKADRIPDLWRNMAHVLAGHEEFTVVARQAGVWNRIHQVVLADDRSEGEPI